MIGFIFRHPVAVLLSIFLHLTLLFFIIFDWSNPDTLVKLSIQGEESLEPKQVATQRMEPLQTFAVDSRLVQQQLDKIREKEEARKLETEMLEAKTIQERQRLKELQKRQKIEQEKAEKARELAKEQIEKAESERKKTELERQKTEEARRLAKLEKQKADAERIKAKEAKKSAELAEKKRLKALEKIKLAEQKKKELEKENAVKVKENESLKRTQEKAQAAAALQRQLDREAEEQRMAKKRKQMLSLKETYISAISAKVRDNWRTPARISPEAQCDLQITQTPKGSVTSVKILNCNEFATKQFKEAAEKAVYRSEPIPEPPVKDLFERVITFEFKP
ncbi:TolA protein [hydrothermal vent metagenome]|uniref:TolA protein n=1 Tax=hydrothermal vent metagenome TaxID=652676 RepID=A0A3B0W9P0_9ZZZZ